MAANYRQSRRVLSCGACVVPAIYPFSTILTEVYGYSISRLVIWSGLSVSVSVSANMLLALGIWPPSLIPTFAEWAMHTGFSDAAYHIIINSYIKTFPALSIAYLFREFINSSALAKLKVATLGKHNAFRIITSSALAVVIDSVIFSLILFLGTLAVPFDVDDYPLSRRFLNYFWNIRRPSRSREKPAKLIRPVGFPRDTSGHLPQH